MHELILACANCATRYRVPVAALGATGRRVRCSKCAHIWHAEPPEVTLKITPLHPPLADREEADASSNRLPIPAPPRPPPRSRTTRYWMALLILLLLCLFAVMDREWIMQVWPGSAGLYEALGLGAAPQHGTGAATR